MKGNRSIRISRTADLILENLRFEGRTKYHKTIYKRDILNWIVVEFLIRKDVHKKFWKTIKNDTEK